MPQIVDPTRLGKDADTQIKRLATSAAELSRAIRRANALPPGFPENELLALANALEDAPSADVEVRLEAGLYVRERLVEVRRRFVSEARDDPNIPGIDAIAHCLNDTIAELSTLIVAAGREAEERARPDRAGKTSIVATEGAGADASRYNARPIEELKTFNSSKRHCNRPR